MLYETAARANEILALNVQDLDVGARRAVVRGQRCHRQEVVWASGVLETVVTGPWLSVWLCLVCRRKGLQGCVPGWWDAPWPKSGSDELIDTCRALCGRLFCADCL